jgi:hypothetical protein
MSVLADSRRCPPTESRRMNKLLSERKLRVIRRKFCPYYKNLARESYCEDEGRYVVAASNHLIRPFAEQRDGNWEEHDQDAVAELAFLINRLLREIDLSGWLVQLGRENWPWFRRSIPTGSNAARIAYLRSFAAKGKMDVSKFCGGLLIDCFPTCFLNLFMDHPFANGTCEMDLINLKKPVLLRLNHHLSACLITSDRSVFDRAIAFYDRSDLRQIQQKPHMYVNASLSAEEFFGVATILP